VLASSRHDSAMERVLVEQNISDIQDPAVFLDGLMHGT